VELSKFEKSFLILIFFGGILSLRQVCFFEISIKFPIFFLTLYDLFQEKKFSPLRRDDFKIYQHKNQKKIDTPPNKEKCLFLNSPRYLLPIQNYMKHCQLKKSLDPSA
jgi:hypothetical protein